MIRLSMPIVIGLSLVAFALVTIGVAVSLGTASVPFSTVWQIVINKMSPGAFAATWSPGRESIVWDVRLPRVILGGLVGAGLGLTGAILQPLTRNPIADPHLLGVSSGAVLGAVIALLHVGMVLGALTVPVFAFAGALVAMMTVPMAARFSGGAQADRLVLAGVAVAFVFTALANLLVFLGDPRATQSVTFWMLGGFGLAEWPHLLYPAVVLFAALAYLMPNARALNAIAMGDETAATLGVPVNRFRITLFVVSALLTGVMVAFSGAIGFVGLMAPHFVRALVGSDNARVLPLSAFMGGVALIWADLAARTIMAPEDMPIGVVTGLVGGLAFIWILRKS
jgi:iron complex transport system permease protein